MLYKLIHSIRAKKKKKIYKLQIPPPENQNNKIHTQLKKKKKRESPRPLHLCLATEHKGGKLAVNIHEYVAAYSNWSTCTEHAHGRGFVFHKYLRLISQAPFPCPVQQGELSHHLQISVSVPKMTSSALAEMLPF